MPTVQAARAVVSQCALQEDAQLTPFVFVVGVAGLLISPQLPRAHPPHLRARKATQHYTEEEQCACYQDRHTSLV